MTSRRAPRRKVHARVQLTDLQQTELYLKDRTDRFSRHSDLLGEARHGIATHVGSLHDAANFVQAASAKGSPLECLDYSFNVKGYHIARFVDPEKRLLREIAINFPNHGQLLFKDGPRLRKGSYLNDEILTFHCLAMNETAAANKVNILFVHPPLAGQIIRRIKYKLEENTPENTTDGDLAEWLDNASTEELVNVLGKLSIYLPKSDGKEDLVKKIQEYPRVVTPYRIGSDHWIGLDVEAKGAQQQQQLQLYDSSKRSAGVNAYYKDDEDLKLLSKALIKLVGGRASGNGLSEHVSESVPQQDDTHKCGVVIGWVMKELASGRELPMNIRASESRHIINTLDQYRLEMAARFLRIRGW